MGSDKAVTIPVQLHARSDSNRRGEERFVAAMPVHVDGAVATTQDLSTGGLSFVTDRSYELGARIQVVIEYLLDGHNYPLECEAEVMRVRAGPDGYTIGARLAPLGYQADIAVPAVIDATLGRFQRS
ncbi:MAG: hypothetical protein JWQ76_4869 [Ramlibacter sp.]|nr:hypothetical protein [Ramlibacter sp.]